MARFKAGAFRGLIGERSQQKVSSLNIEAQAHASWGGVAAVRFKRWMPHQGPGAVAMANEASTLLAFGRKGWEAMPPLKFGVAAPQLLADGDEYVYAASPHGRSFARWRPGLSDWELAAVAQRAESRQSTAWIAAVQGGLIALRSTSGAFGRNAVVQPVFFGESRDTPLSQKRLNLKSVSGCEHDPTKLSLLSAFHQPTGKLETRAHLLWLSPGCTAKGHLWHGQIGLDGRVVGARQVRAHQFLLQGLDLFGNSQLRSGPGYFAAGGGLFDMQFRRIPIRQAAKRRWPAHPGIPLAGEQHLRAFGYHRGTKQGAALVELQGKGLRLARFSAKGERLGPVRGVNPPPATYGNRLAYLGSHWYLLPRAIHSAEKQLLLPLDGGKAISLRGPTPKGTTESAQKQYALHYVQSSGGQLSCVALSETPNAPSWVLQLKAAGTRGSGGWRAFPKDARAWEQVLPTKYLNGGPQFPHAEAQTPSDPRLAASAPPVAARIHHGFDTWWVSVSDKPARRLSLQAIDGSSISLPHGTCPTPDGRSNTNCPKLRSGFHWGWGNVLASPPRLLSRGYALPLRPAPSAAKAFWSTEWLAAIATGSGKALVLAKASAGPLGGSQIGLIALQTTTDPLPPPPVQSVQRLRRRRRSPLGRPPPLGGGIVP